MIARYLRLYGYFVRFSFSRAMEFRVDFTFRIVMDMMFYAVNILFFEVVFLHTNLLGGWTENQMMVFVAGFLIVDAVSMTLFSNNLWMLGDYVNHGDLDYHLIRPVSTLFMVSLRDFAANSFMNLLMAFAILVWALSRYDGVVTPGRVLLFLVLILNGTYLRYCVRLLTIIPVFWLHSARGLEMLFFHMSRLMERPDAIFTGVVRVVLITVLPYILMASFPARIFFDGLDWRLLGMIVGVTVLFTVAVQWFWRVGLKAYSSASS